jgi:DNA segregation ATPase FtsK/SpoIIIE-like protein
MSSLDKLIARPVEEPPPQRPDWISRLAARWNAFEARLDAVTFPRPVDRLDDWLISRRNKRAEQSLLHASEKAERERRRKLQNELIAESWKYMSRMIGVSRRFSELSHTYPKSDREEAGMKTNTIGFTHVVMTPEILYFKVDTIHSPENVRISALADDDTLLSMSMSCEKRVSCEYDPEKGFWYIIERATGTRGIPFHVRLDEIWATRKLSYDGLAIPFGITGNKRPVWYSPTQFSSLLVAGATGTGKSNFVNVAICTWIRFNSPRMLKLVLIDLKNGVELSAYEKLPHLLRYKALEEKYDPEGGSEETGNVDDKDRADTVLAETGALISEDGTDDGMRVAFVDAPKKVMPLLRAIYWEGWRRLALLRKAHCRDIGTYNWKHYRTALSHIVVVFDELAQLVSLPKGDEEKAKELFGQIAGLFRAAGIYVMPSTQRPDKTVITGIIKQNCPARLAFGCSDMHSSMLIIGDGSAVGLNPRGRAKLQWGGRIVEVQTPYMPDQVIARVIEQAQAGQYEEIEIKRHDVTEDEIFHVGLETFGGDLPLRELWRHFQNQERMIPRDEVQDVLKRYSGKEIMIKGVLYHVQPAKGTRPASLVVAEEDEATT